jgi:hypothetical protein
VPCKPQYPIYIVFHHDSVKDEVVNGYQGRFTDDARYGGIYMSDGNLQDPQRLIILLFYKRLVNLLDSNLRAQNTKEH